MQEARHVPRAPLSKYLKRVCVLKMTEAINDQIKQRPAAITLWVPTRVYVVHAGLASSQSGNPWKPVSNNSEPVKGPQGVPRGKKQSAPWPSSQLKSRLLRPYHRKEGHSIQSVF